MANRVIRDWTTSDKMNELSIGAESFFTRLIMKADDYGSFHSNAKLLNAALFPLKDYSINEVCEWLAECVNAGLIIAYEVEGKGYIRIINFGQRLQNMRNTFPQPPSDLNEKKSNQNNSQQVTVNHGDSLLETKRNETEEESETEKESDRFLIFGSKSEFFISVKTKYTTDKPKTIYNLRLFFNSDQLEMFEKNKWNKFEEFMKDNPGRVFDDDNHVYNTFKSFHLKSGNNASKIGGHFQKQNGGTSEKFSGDYTERL